MGFILLLCGFSFPSGWVLGWRMQGRDTEGISAFVPKAAGKGNLAAMCFGGSFGETLSWAAKEVVAANLPRGGGGGVRTVC